MSEKVVVTGAAGFIGSHLVELLVKEGYEVRAFVHYNSNANSYHLEELPENMMKSIELFQGDVTDPYSVSTAVKDCRYVFHLAALIGIPYSYLAPQSYVATNVMGTLNVLEACRKEGVEKLLHTSTSETYGTAQYVPIDEKHPLVGQSPYSASKIGADKLAESYANSFQLPVSIVRPFNTFGPRQSMRAVIPSIIGQYLTQKELQLGSLEPVRDFTYVTDTAMGFLQAARSDQATGRTINLGYGKGVSINKLVKIIGKLMGKDLPVNSSTERIRPANSEVYELTSDNTLASVLMDWRPEVALEQGLENTIDYFKRHIEGLNASSYGV